MSASATSDRRRWVLPAVLAVARRPALWPIAARQAWRLRTTGWWRRPPFLPVPDRAYLRFRALTAYGDPDAGPATGDVLTYLRWSRGWSAAVRSSAGGPSGRSRWGRIR